MLLESKRRPKNSFELIECQLLERITPQYLQKLPQNKDSLELLCNIATSTPQVCAVLVNDERTMHYIVQSLDTEAGLMTLSNLLCD